MDNGWFAMICAAVSVVMFVESEVDECQPDKASRLRKNKGALPASLRLRISRRH
jgi:hypothetical protein